MADALTVRADRAAEARFRPPADARTGLHALKLAQERQRIREGRPEAVEAAMRSSGLLKPVDEHVGPNPSHPSALPDVRWFVAQTKPGAEGIATRALTEAGFRACAPTVGYWVVSHRQERVRSSYVFPRYAFVGLVPDARGDVDFRSPRLCDGVASFVEAAGCRAEVRDEAIGDLMATTEMGWLDLIRDRAFRHVPKSTPDRDAFVRTMAEILACDAAGRMRLFLHHFGERRGLSDRVVCGMSDATA